jgi:REP element-mobilizing transposase RayT
VEGGVYHVYARGNAKGIVYRNDVDRWIYLRRLERVVDRSSWICLAYCLLDNHVHLLLETPVANLSSGMQWLHSGYAQGFNARHGRSGHVFQGRYGAVRITSDAQLCMTAAYIARNPIEAGLCERPDDWSWSSCRPVIREKTPRWLDGDRLLRYFGDEADKARRWYLEMSSWRNLNGV